MVEITPPQFNHVFFTNSGSEANDTNLRLVKRYYDQLGKPEKLHIISHPIEVLLFTELSVVIGMTQIYCVFMVGPIAFMLGRIDRNIIEAARDLGAGFGRIFWKIIFPLSLPGVVVGAIFVSVMVLGEFATSGALSGRKVNLLGNIIVTQVGSLKWAMASVTGVILTVVMGMVIAAFLRIVDLKQEL